MLLLNILQYWGWAKHRYREVYKDRLDTAKKIVHKSLDACPVEVVQWFFNHLWWWTRFDGEGSRMGRT